MGIDCPDIYNVIQCGSPATVEKTGRAGKNSEFCSTLLYGSSGKHVEKSMTDYYSNSNDARLFKLFILQRK